MLKLLEAIERSLKGHAEADQTAIEQCTYTGKIMHFFQVIEHRGAVRKGRIKEYQVKLKISIE